jgi:AraC-like DNA-binding protein
MLLAAHLLREHGESVQRVVPHVGYEAEVAFSRALERQFGVAPGQYRQQSAGLTTVGSPRA